MPKIKILPLDREIDAQAGQTIMAAALGAGWMWAIGLKGSITIGIAAGLWLGRRYRIVRRAGVGFIGVFAVLVLYQLVNTWVI